MQFRHYDNAVLACQNPSPVIDGKQANCNLASQNTKPNAAGGEYTAASDVSTDQHVTGDARRGGKRNFAGSYGTPGYGTGMGTPGAWGAGAAPGYGVAQWGSTGSTPYVQTGHGAEKRRKLGGSEGPRVSYVQQLQQETGTTITKEYVKDRIDSLRDRDPCEAYKYFLEMSELFQGTDEYQPLYESLLAAAREVRQSQQAEQGQYSMSELSHYYQQSEEQGEESYGAPQHGDEHHNNGEGEYYAHEQESYQEEPQE